MCMVAVHGQINLCIVICICAYILADSRTAELEFSSASNATSESSPGALFKFNQCDELHHCINRNSTYQYLTCECDDLCHIYGDCCMDKGENITVSDPSIFGIVIKHFGTCSHIHGYTMDIFVVDKCPVSYSEDYIRNSCEEVADDVDILLQVPVSESRFGVAFSNLYCAICHGWSRDQVFFWTVLMDCFPEQQHHKHHNEHIKYNRNVLTRNMDDIEGIGVQQLWNQSVCSHQFKPPSTPDGTMSTRPCYKALISTCDPDWDNQTVLDRCVYDHQGLIWTNSVPSKLYRNKYCALCRKEGMFQCHPPTFKERAMANNESGIFAPIHHQPVRNDNWGVPVSISVLLDFNSGTVTIDGTTTIPMDCSEGTIYDPFKDLCRSLVCPSGFILEREECIAYTKPTPTSFVVHPHSNDTDKVVKPYPNNTDMVFNSSSGRQQYNTNTVFNESGTIFACPMISLESDEYILLDNGTVYINQTQQMFLNGDYLKQNSTILICVMNYNVTTAVSFKQIMNEDIVQGVLSICGQILSVIALLILLMIYAANPPLQNLPGKCLMSFSFSLFLAQLLFLVGMFIRNFSDICKVIAILTHFFFLVSFFWMNVMAFDVWRTFHSQFQTNTLDHKMKFICYSCYAFIIPSLIITFTSTIDHISISTLSKPAYGIGLCWITNKQAIFYYFALPLSLILSCNIILFSIAIWNIYKVQRGTEVLRKGKSGIKCKRLVLYMKLSTIMGLTWIFGFLASLTSVDMIWYLFVMFNSLQGLFICIAFTFNTKVYRLTKAKMRRFIESDSFNLFTSNNINLPTSNNINLSTSNNTINISNKTN